MKAMKSIFLAIVLFLSFSVNSYSEDEKAVFNIDSGKEFTLQPGMWKEIKSEKLSTTYWYSYCGTDEHSFMLCYWSDKNAFFPPVKYDRYEAKTTGISFMGLKFKVLQVTINKITLKKLGISPISPVPKNKGSKSKL